VGGERELGADCEGELTEGRGAGGGGDAGGHAVFVCLGAERVPLRRERKKDGFDSLLPPPCRVDLTGWGRWWWVESLVAGRLTFFILRRTGS